MEQALAYVCCSAEESRVKVQKYCRKIYELGYVPICPRSVSYTHLDVYKRQKNYRINQSDRAGDVYKAASALSVYKEKNDEMCIRDRTNTLAQKSR